MRCRDRTRLGAKLGSRSGRRTGIASGLAVLTLVAFAASGARAITIEVLSVQKETFGNAEVDVGLSSGNPGGTLGISLQLPAGDLFSSARAVVDLAIHSDGPVSFGFYTTEAPRDLGGCEGSCDPVQGLTAALFQLTPELDVLASLQPTFIFDTHAFVRDVSPGSFRIVADLSQVGGRGDARLGVYMQLPVPEPEAHLLFPVGALVFAGALRRSPAQ